MPDPELMQESLKEYFDRVTPEQYFVDVQEDEKKPELYDSRETGTTPVDKNV